MHPLRDLRQHLRSARALAGLTPSVPAALVGGVDGLLRRRARATPDRPAVRTPERTLTFAELDRAADRAARLWRTQGIGRGEVVAILMENRPETLVHQFGLARIGAAAALINTHLQGAALAHVLRAARARAIIVDGTHAAALDTLGAPVEVFAPHGAWLAAEPEAAPPGHRLRDLQAALAATSGARVRGTLKGTEAVFSYLFTSGTTGLPKAAPIRHHRHLVTGAGLQWLALWLRPRDVVFTAMPLYHASAQLVAMSTALAAGACFAFSRSFSARRFWAEAAAVDATVAIYVGEVCRYLLAAPPTPNDPRQSIHTFLGNGLRGDVWPAFQARFGHPRVVEFYGATEGNAFLINRSGKVGSCGRPLFVGPFDGLALVRYDVDADRHPRDARGHLIRCADDEVGELICRIGLLPTERFDGYLDAAETDAKVLTNVFRTGDRYFRTGDLLRRDAEGDYFFVDRIGDTFRWKGENVSTQEVAEALVGAGGAEALTVYGVLVPGREGRAGMAAVSLRPGTPFDGADLYQRAADALPAYARPVFVRLCGALDRTSTMKFQKNRVVREGFGPEAEPVFVRDDAQGTYVPLDATRRAAIGDGTLRL